MNLIYMLEDTVYDACSNYPGLNQILTVVGWVIFGIKIIAPIVLLIVGMIDMTKAIAGKDEDTIKKAQKALGKKAIAAVVVFLIATMVGIVMSLVGGKEYKKCTTCINAPWTETTCGITSKLE